MVIAFKIHEASAKVRTGPPKDDEEDYSLNVWAGIQPILTVKGPTERDPDLKQGVKLPSYLK